MGIKERTGLSIHCYSLFQSNIVDTLLPSFLHFHSPFSTFAPEFWDRVVILLLNSEDSEIQKSENNTWLTFVLKL